MRRGEHDDLWASSSDGLGRLDTLAMKLLYLDTSFLDLESATQPKERTLLDDQKKRRFRPKHATNSILMDLERGNKQGEGMAG